MLLYHIPVYHSLICSPLHYSDSIVLTASESELPVKAFMLLLFMVIRHMLSDISELPDANFQDTILILYSIE